MHYYSADIVRLEQQLQAVWQEHVKLQQSLEETVAQLRAENEELQRKLQSMKPVSIENITYKIQELSVKELSGSLHIGMSAISDPEQIKQWLEQDQQEEAVRMHDMEQDSPD